jgi:hypothetical protein
LGISWSDSGNTHQRIYLAKHAFPHPFLWRYLWLMPGAFGLKETGSSLVISPLGYLLGSCFKEEVLRHMIRIKSSLHQCILDWLDAI